MPSPIHYQIPQNDGDDFNLGYWHDCIAIEISRQITK